MAQTPQQAKPHAQHSFVKWQTIAAAAGTLALGVGAYLYAMPLHRTMLLRLTGLDFTFTLLLPYSFFVPSVWPPFSESPSTIAP